MMRSAADLGTANSGFNCCSGRFVHQYAAISKPSPPAVSSRASIYALSPSLSRRNTVSNLPNRRRLRPVNQTIQDGFDTNRTKMISQCLTLRTVVTQPQMRCLSPTL